MLKNFFITAIRNLFKHKGYLFINIIGLAIGLASFIFISLYVIHELSYDRFHSQYENIYRLKIKGQMSGQELHQAITAAPTARAVLDDYPEIEKAVRIAEFGAWLIRYEDKKFNEDGILFADSTFFDIFDFNLLRGNPKTALVSPRSMIMTETFATKYFGNEDPMGKSLSVEEDTIFYTVTGIIEDTPENSHFHFDMIGSMNSIRNSRSENWVSHNYYTYLTIKEGTSIPELDTYRYFDGHQYLRHWICLPLVMGINDRKEGTLDALFSKLWTDNGVRVEYNPSLPEPNLFWDRGTLYAFRGAFKAGAANRGLEKLHAYSQTRLLGFHVPYVVEAWPEGNMAHLSAESALYCRIFTEGLLGITPTGFQSFTLQPHLPSGWDQLVLKNVYAFGEIFDLSVLKQKSKLEILIERNNNVIFRKLIKHGEALEVAF